MYAALLFAAAAVLEIVPNPAVECPGGNNSLAQVAVQWSGASGPVDIRIGTPTGPSMTGLAGSSGRALTGAWVRDGMKFLAVNEAGGVEAEAVARVRCGAAAGASGNSYFPLQVGNTWVYRYNSRAVTNDYVTRTVTHTEELGGQIYYVTAGGDLQRYRADAEGRVYRFTGTAAAPREELLLDPATAERVPPYASALGEFPDAVAATQTAPLGRNRRVFARGLGLVEDVATVSAGSSGGFASGLYLVEARLEGGALRVAVPAPGLALAVETQDLDVTGRKAPDCRVPSYCVGCPGDASYKPCVQVRVEGTRAAALASAVSVPRYVQVPLPLAPGAYRLVARGGEMSATAELSVR